MSTENNYKFKIKDNIYDFNGVDSGFRILEKSENEWVVSYKNKIKKAEIKSFDPNTKEYVIVIDNIETRLTLMDHVDILVEEMGMNKVATTVVDRIIAPMPGLVLDILVHPDQEVMEGDSVAIVEAMKMENVLKSPGSGIVASIAVSKGDKVEKDQLLIRFKK